MVASPDNVAFVQALVATLLLVASAAKLRDRTSLSAFLVALGFRADVRSVAVAVAPVVEAGVGVWLLSGRLPTAAALAAAALGATFLALHAKAALARVDAGCGCFGSLSGDEALTIGATRASFFALASFALVILVSFSGAKDSVIGTPAACGIATGISSIVAFTLTAQVSAFRAARADLIGSRQQGEV